MRVIAPLLFAAGLACWFVGARVAADDLKPPEKPDTPALRSEAELTALIDAELAKVWQRDGITPAKPCNDETFLRRAYLDTVGLPPTLAEIEAFLADKAEDRRARLIDKLVDDPRFGEHLSDEWMKVLLRREQGRDGGDAFFSHWFMKQMNEDRGLDQVFYDIITATGTIEGNPAAAYYLQIREYITPDVAGNATKQFTGVQIQCAQCHDHPYEKNWKTAEFDGVASFFAGLRVRNDGNLIPRFGTVADDRVERVDEATVQARLKGLNDQQKKEFYERVRYRKPKYLLGAVSQLEDTTLLRTAWAKWVISKANAQTQRYMANRVWSFAFGRGIHNPVDDFNSVNTPSHPELLDALAADFRDSGFRTKRLYRAMLKSRAWQLGSAEASRKDDLPVEDWHFARAAVRQLSAEQFFGALVTLTPDGQGLRRTMRKAERNPYTRQIEEGERFEKRRAEDKLKENEKRIKYDFDSLRKLEAMYDEIPNDWIVRRRSAAVYLRMTTDDEMTQSDGFNLTIDQALLVMNGQMMNSMATSDRQSILAGLLSGGKDDADRLRQLYLKLLSRAPTEEENTRLLEYVKGGKTAWEDVIFALLMTTEFATNH